MAIGDGLDVLASDFVASSAGAGDSGKAPKLGPGGKLDPSFFTIESGTGVTYSLTTVAGQQVIVWAKGDLATPGGSTGDLFTISLKYNGVTKDSIVVNGGSVKQHGFALMYAQVPGAATQNITVETSGGSLADVAIMILKIG